MDVVCFADGVFLPKSKVSISIDDLGFARGYALFEHFKTYSQKPFHSLDHLNRLFDAAKNFYIKPPFSIGEISEILEKLFQVNQFLEAGFKIYLTSGPGNNELLENFPSKPSFFVIPYPIVKRPTFDEKGIFVKTTKLQRSFSNYKTTHYLPCMKAQMDARVHALKMGEKIPNEMLYVDEDQNLLEGSYSGLCVFENDKMILPKTNMLPSITQQVMARLASKYFEVVCEKIPYSSLSKITEVLFASSVSEIRAITQLDHFSFPCGKNTLLLKKEFDAYIQHGDWPLLDKFNYASLISCS